MVAYWDVWPASGTTAGLLSRFMGRRLSLSVGCVIFIIATVILVVTVSDGVLFSVDFYLVSVLGTLLCLRSPAFKYGTCQQASSEHIAILAFALPLTPRTRLNTFATLSTNEDKDRTPAPSLSYLSELHGG